MRDASEVKEENYLKERLLNPRHTKDFYASKVFSNLGLTKNVSSSLVHCMREFQARMDTLAKEWAEMETLIAEKDCDFNGHQRRIILLFFQLKSVFKEPPEDVLETLFGIKVKDKRVGGESWSDHCRRMSKKWHVSGDTVVSELQGLLRKSVEHFATQPTLPDVWNRVTEDTQALAGQMLLDAQLPARAAKARRDFPPSQTIGRQLFPKYFDDLKLVRIVKRGLQNDLHAITQCPKNLYDGTRSLLYLTCLVELDEREFVTCLEAEVFVFIFGTSSL